MSTQLEHVMQRPRPAEPAVAAQVGSDPPRSAAALLVLVCAAQFMVALDVTIVNVALPSINAALRFGPGDLQWVVSIYTLATGGLLLVGGRLTDLYGARRLFVVGTALFTLASVTSGAAPSSAVLVASRAAQGVGAALLAPAGLSVLSNTFSGPRRARALGVWGAIASGGAGLGLLVGGALTTWLSWSWIFFVNVPVGIACLLAAGLIPAGTGVRRRRQIDVPGVVLGIAAPAALVYGISGAGTHGWTSTRTVGILVSGLALAAVFALVERHALVPLVPSSLWSQRSLTVSTIGMFGATIVLAGTLFLSTFLMQTVEQASPLETGLALLPTAVAIGFAAHLTGRLLPVVGARVLSAGGLAVSAVGALLLSRVPADAGYVMDLLPAFVLLGLGLGVCFPALSATCMADVQAARSGTASGVFMTAHDLGGAFGVAVLSTAAGGALADLAGQQRGFLVNAGIALGFALVCLVAMTDYRPPADAPAPRGHGMLPHGSAEPAAPLPAPAPPLGTAAPGAPPPAQPTGGRTGRARHSASAVRAAARTGADCAPDHHAAPRTSPGVTVQGLSKRFGDVEAVRDLTFAAPMGAVTGFVGANGAGKTTTLRVLLGLVEPTSGTALVAGRRLVDLANPRTLVGAVLDTPGAHPAHTGRAHLEILASASGITLGRVDEVLARVDLSGAADRRVGSYSLGMRQRLSLAAALLADPPVLVLDEPTKGLDPPGILWLRGLVRGLADEGRCVLMSSHHLSELQTVADRLVVLQHGQLVAEGPLQDLLRMQTSRVTVRSPHADRLSALLHRDGLAVTRTSDGALEIGGVSQAQVGRLAAQEGLELHHLADRENELEELYHQLTQGSRDR